MNRNMNKYYISRFFLRLIALLLTGICLTGFFPSTAAADPSDDEVATIFRRRKASGGMVLAAKDGQIVYSFCFGYANKKTKEFIIPDSYFKLASVSKLITAAAVMRLVDSGQLDLDENIGHFLGNPPYEAANPHFPEISLTSRLLMTHTAGVKDSKGAFADRWKLSDILKPELNRFGSGFLKNEPGTVYHYSNYGAGIMGCILEAVTGLRLTDAVRNLLFDPMKIDAAYDPTLLQFPERIVTTYRANGEADITRTFRLRQKYNDQINLEKDYGESYGSVWMKGEDLCRIGIMLCDMGIIDGQRILSESAVREMTSSQAGRGGIQTDSPYGLNVERVQNLLPGKLIFGHQGLSNGVLCSLYFDPDTRFVFTLLTNGCNVNAKQDHICMLSRDLFSLMWSSFADSPE